LEHGVGVARALRVEVLLPLAEDAVQHDAPDLLVGHPHCELVLRRLADRLDELGRIDGGGIDFHQPATRSSTSASTLKFACTALTSSCSSSASIRRMSCAT